MADTTFVDGTTLTAADWFNDVNRVVYTILADPADAAAARAAMDAQQDVFTTIGDSVVATTAGAAARLPAAASVAAHATTANIWVAREITLTGGVVTFTDIADAPYVGAVAWVKQNAAHIWTDGAVFEVQGNANYTAVASDWIRVEATTVSTFSVTIFRADGTAVAGSPAASQADQETGTSTTLAVTPGRQQFHPSAAKAWAFVDRSAGTPTLGALDYGVASVTDDGAAQTIVTFDTAMSGTTYIPLTSATNNAGDNIIAAWHTRATGSVKVLMTTGGGVASDTNSFAIGIFGDQ